VKKMINNPENVVSEFIEGLVYSRPDLRRLGGSNCVIKAEPTPRKVALVSLGGSGHEPAHAGYIGLNGLDGVACGQVFASPSTEQIYETAKAVHTGEGVLFIVKNYMGDILNTDMAIERLNSEGIKTGKLIVRDDVAPIPGISKEDRRGVAGTILIHKILGCAAKGYHNLGYLMDLGTRICKNMKTMGLALSPCTIPSVGKPNFTIPEDKVTVGIGIHGEAGIYDKPLGTCNDHVDELLGIITKDFDMDYNELKDSNCVVMVNGMGSTPLIELYVINKRVRDNLQTLGVNVLRNPVGEYLTSLEMAGFSITILKVELDYRPLLISLD
jgi:dihydroxyacetone kinase-like protein